MKITFSILLLFAVISTHAQDLSPGTEVRVINILGARVFEKPSFEAHILSELPPGTQLTVERIEEKQDSLQLGNDFYLPGSWIKPARSNGFLFSSDLTAREVRITKDEHGRTTLDFLGKLTGQQEESNPVATPNGTYPKYVETKHFENGSYTYSAFDGCFDHVYEFKDLSLKEVYHQMISRYAPYSEGIGEYWIPEPLSVEGNIIRFSEVGASMDLKIETRTNGTYLVSSYDCD